MSAAGRLESSQYLTLLGTPSFTDSSRHYLLETLITLESLLLLYFIGRYAEARGVRTLVAIGTLIAAGLLTKFNFFFYAVWLFVVPVTMECYRTWRHQQPASHLLAFFAVIVAFPLAFAGPWYVVRATSPNNALELLGKQLAAGHSISSLRSDVHPFSAVVELLASVGVAGDPCLCDLCRLSTQNPDPAFRTDPVGANAVVNRHKFASRCILRSSSRGLERDGRQHPVAY